MAKGKGTSTPAKVRQQRENAEALKGGSETDDILKQLEADKAEALAKIEADFQAKREKAVEKQLEPLRARREELDQTIRDAEAEQEDIDRQIAKLTGAKVKSKRGGAAGGAGGSRMKAEDKQRFAAEALKFVEGGSKDGVSRSAVAEKLGISAGQAATVLKALTKDGKIKTNGQPKSLSRYLGA